MFQNKTFIKENPPCFYQTGAVVCILTSLTLAKSAGTSRAGSLAGGQPDSDRAARVESGGTRQSACMTASMTAGLVARPLRLWPAIRLRCDCNRISLAISFHAQCSLSKTRNKMRV